VRSARLDIPMSNGWRPSPTPSGLDTRRGSTSNERASPVPPRLQDILGQDHVGKIVPSRKQECFEHRQGRPSLLAFCRRIEQRQNLIRKRPINPCAKLVEARLALGFCAKPKDFLPDPPLRHDALQISMGRTEKQKFVMKPSTSTPC
jgi:hypothetical protein